MEAQLERWRYRGVLTLLSACAFLLCLRLGYLFLADANRFPINTVKIAANYNHISRQHIESVLSNYLNESFFSLSTGHLERDLKDIAWTNMVKVHRVWPDVLTIKLVEKDPVARWNNELITADGHLFTANAEKENPDLPELKGPMGQHVDTLQIFQKLSKLLASYNLRMASLQLYENQSCDLVLNNRIYLRLGKKDLEQRLERFCKAYQAALQDKSEQLASVDLRYERGMAVKWGQQTGR